MNEQQPSEPIEPIDIDTIQEDLQHIIPWSPNNNSNNNSNENDNANNNENQSDQDILEIGNCLQQIINQLTSFIQFHEQSSVLTEEQINHYNLCIHLRNLFLGQSIILNDDVANNTLNTHNNNNNRQIIFLHDYLVDTTNELPESSPQLRSWYHNSINELLEEDDFTTIDDQKSQENEQENTQDNNERHLNNDESNSTENENINENINENENGNENENENENTASNDDSTIAQIDEIIINNENNNYIVAESTTTFVENIENIFPTTTYQIQPIQPSELFSNLPYSRTMYNYQNYPLSSRISIICNICNQEIVDTCAKVILHCECQFHLECFLKNKNKKKCLNCQDIIFKKCNEDYRKCSICLEILNTNIRKLICKHNFHEKCIRNWEFSGNYNCSKCPMCRNFIQYLN